MSVQINLFMFHCRMRLACYPKCHARMDILPLRWRFLSDGVQDPATSQLFFPPHLSSSNLKVYLCSCYHIKIVLIPFLFAPSSFTDTPVHFPRNDLFQKDKRPIRYLLIITPTYYPYLLTAFFTEKEKIHKSRPKVHHRTVPC